MTIASAFNEITENLGGTPSTSGTIASAIDALNDTLAGSDQDAAQTIEGAIRLLGENIGSGGGGETSRFSTAQVTVTNTATGKTLGIDVDAALVEEEGEPSYLGSYTYNLDSTVPVTITVVLLDGEGWITLSDYDNDSATTTGGVDRDGESDIFIVTGDGTLSAAGTATLG